MERHYFNLIKKKEQENLYIKKTCSKKNNIGPEESKFRDCLKKEVENGLTEFRIIQGIQDINCNKDGSLNIYYVELNSNKEEFFKELNSMNEAIASGKCTPINEL